ncbi:hypothetical protein QO010_000373 [Caulobacter ginsengisoli]|uniref:Putative DnaT-like domain-containing protein n=1 Tax=Caulobacter ginsengisoli TaxID=400775 RepID=A0ABU0IKS9_9CAUL|nr:DnaT-like ssDNA-binding protein [Caulobacter ginsengisoli]MDQ0462625.1 hypothetical protein [Caulobacter ginsengisoli]
MALIVEDGTGRADAEAFVSVAGFKAYCDGRGVDWSSLADAQIEALLRQGADYLGEAYRGRLAGWRVSTRQALDWPRAGAPRRDAGGCVYYDSASVPGEVARANIEAALRARNGALSQDLGQAVKRKKVGAVEVEYQDFTRAGAGYPVIDALMAPFMAADLRVVRA